MATSKKLKLTRKPRKIKKRSVKRKTVKKHVKVGGDNCPDKNKLLRYLCIGLLVIVAIAPAIMLAPPLLIIAQIIESFASGTPQADVNSMSNILNGASASVGKIDQKNKIIKGGDLTKIYTGSGLSFKVRGNNSIIDKCKDKDKNYRNKITKEDGLWRPGVLYSQKQFIDCTEQDWWKEAYNNMTSGEAWGLDKYDKISTEEMQILNSIVLTGTYRYITKFSLFKSRQFSVLKQLKNLKDNKQKLEQQFNHNIMNTELPNKSSNKNTIAKILKELGIKINFDDIWMVIRSFAHAIDYFCNTYDEHEPLKQKQIGKFKDMCEDIQNTDGINLDPDMIKKIFSEYINPVYVQYIAVICENHETQ